MKILEKSTTLVQLIQIANGPVWDGDLISKSETDHLLKRKLVIKVNGFTILEPTGLMYLLDLKLIRH